MEAAALASLVNLRISSVFLQQLCKHYKSWTKVWSEPLDMLKQLECSESDSEKLLERSDEIFESCREKIEKYDVMLVHLGQKKYPPLLKQLESAAPFCLFVRGNVSALTALNPIAVVGTRAISEYGKMALQEIIPPLARSSVTIVSGLAFGVDSLAHKIALEYHGRCVAVFASGVDLVYPALHWPLAKRIIEAGGALVSEQPLGEFPKKQHFPARNRIISGLCHSTIVIEAKLKSGSHITAKNAVDQGRNLYAVPGSIFLPNQQGTNWLISEHATPILSAADLLEKLRLDASLASRPGPELVFHSDEERLIYDALIEPRSLDDLSESLKLPIQKISKLISMMELKSIVLNFGGARYGRR